MYKGLNTVCQQCIKTEIYLYQNNYYMHHYKHMLCIQRSKAKLTEMYYLYIQGYISYISLHLVSSKIALGLKTLHSCIMGSIGFDICGAWPTLTQCLHIPHSKSNMWPVQQQQQQLQSPLSSISIYTWCIQKQCCSLPVSGSARAQRTHTTTINRHKP